MIGGSKENEQRESERKGSISASPGVVERELVGHAPSLFKWRLTMLFTHSALRVLTENAPMSDYNASRQTEYQLHGDQSRNPRRREPDVRLRTRIPHWRETPIYYAMAIFAAAFGSPQAIF